MTRENDIDVLARTIYGEARGENRMGKKAIACVVMNRYKSGRWFAGKTIAETCKFRIAGSKFHQFSCWNEHDPNRKLIENASELQLGECLEIAGKFVDGVYKDFLCNACHYHTANMKPAWAKGKKADFLIGNHLFYVGID